LRWCADGRSWNWSIGGRSCDHLRRIRLDHVGFGRTQLGGDRRSYRRPEVGELHTKLNDHFLHLLVAADQAVSSVDLRQILTVIDHHVEACIT
jgi:hypothetical protein